MNRLLLVFCLLISSSFFSCNKELSYVGGPDGPLNIVLADPITATLQGNVLDENNQPAAGVTISVGAKTATTDSKGFFRMLDAPLDKNAALVTAQKSGYFKALRTFSATSGTNQVEIKLIRKTLSGTVNGSAGGEVSLSNGSKIALPAGGIVVASSGADYTGDVNVYAAYIDPTADDISQTIPGSFMADDKRGSRVSLISYGMLAVDLEGASGQKLQIKTGSTATLTTAIPATQQASAPAEIALWSIDDQTGIWKEESTAKKSGNNYVGQVSHFSFWNCDVGVPAVKLTVTLQDKNGSAIVHAVVKISSASNGTSFGITDSLGVVSGLVPSNQSLSLEVLTKCHTSIFTQNLGALTQNTSLPPITLTGAAFNSAVFTITGSLVNCTSQPVTSGYVIISYGNSSRWVATDASGQFSTNFLHCPGSNITSFQVLGVDNATQQQGNTVNGTVTLPATSTGNISACGTSSAQFVNFTLDGTAYAISSNLLTDSIGGTTNKQATTSQFVTTLNANENTQNIYMSLNHNTATTGTYPVNSYIGIFVGGSSYFAQGNTNVNISFTTFPQNLGEFYEGNFSGTFIQGITTHTITNGSFKLRRNN